MTEGQGLTLFSADIPLTQHPLFKAFFYLKHSFGICESRYGYSVLLIYALPCCFCYYDSVV